MHKKLHSWLDKHTIIPNEKQKERNEKGCIRCQNCSKPIENGLVFCSQNCNHSYNAIKRDKERGISKPNKEVLSKEVMELPMTKLGKKYGVSDVTVKKWCKAYEIDLGERKGRLIK